MPNIGKSEGNVILNKEGSVRDHLGSTIITKEGNIVITKNTVVKKNVGIFLDGREKTSVVTNNNDLFLNAKQLYDNYNGKLKFDSNLNVIPDGNSFVAGKYYYLLNYVSPYNTGHSFITEVVDSLGKSNIGSGSPFTGSEIRNLELYMISNCNLSNGFFSTDSGNNYRINSVNEVSVSNVSKISIEGLKSDSDIPFESRTSAVDDTILNYARSYHSAQLIGNRIYIISGINNYAGGPNANIDTSFEKINVNNDTSNLINSAFSEDKSSNTSQTYNNYIYILGGWTSDKAALLNTSTDVVHSEITGQFTTNKRKSNSVISGEIIYVISGEFPTSNKIEKYNAFTNTGLGEISTDIIPGARSSRTNSELVGSYIYIMGGYYNSDIARFNISSEVAQTINTNFNSYNAASELVGSYIYIFGGYSYYTSIRKFFSISETIKTVGSISSSDVNYATATLVGNKIYIVGGYYTYDSVQKLGVTNDNPSNVIALRFNQ